MSRKSRYPEEENSVRNIEPLWKAGIYIRLSKEDDDKKDIVSQSIISQQKIVDKFLSEHKEVETVDYFIDDGYSGTNMDRPSFQRMKDAFESGVINCIIVKDLSRFARNDEEASRYLYVIFPFYNIRFISVNDKVDSFENPESISNLEIPFKNIMHSEYSRDISKKVRSASDIRRRRGEFIGAFCSYGYQKNPNDIHCLIIDDEAAEIVRYIFKRYIETENFLKIAKELSANNILTPCAYKHSKGLNIKVPYEQISSTVWKDRTVKRILTNEVYIGHLIQGRRRTVSYKNKKIIKTVASEWIKVENTHEAIISPEMFAQVQALIEKNKRTKGQTLFHNLFAGILFCGDCGASMTVNKRGKDSHLGYFFCNIAYLKKGICTPKRIRSDKLEQIVLDILNCHLKMCVDISELLCNVAANSKRISKNTDVQQNSLLTLKNAKAELYYQYKEGRLTKEQFILQKTYLEDKILDTEKLLQAQTVKIDEYNIKQYQIFSEFIAQGKFNELTRDTLEKFVRKIIVYSPTEIEIEFKFSDELEKINSSISFSKLNNADVV